MLKQLHKWWRNRKWVYLGYTQLWADVGKPTERTVCSVHFYAWGNNLKKRKWIIQGGPSYTESFLRNQPWYGTKVIPWLNGGDMWKPIQTPIAIAGNLIDFYKDPASVEPK